MDFNTRIVGVHNYATAKKFFAEVGSSQGGSGVMTPKSLFYTIVAENLSDPAANILKQEMLSKGGECAIHRDALTHKTGRSSVMMMGTVKQFKGVALKLKGQVFKLSQLGQEIATLLEHLTREGSWEMGCKNGPLTFGERTLVMGILNITPNSFSDGGRFNQMDLALEHASQMVAEGADIIDVGGESTHPGYQMIDTQEEIERIVPVIEALVKKINVPISIDTYKAEVAKRALAAGAGMLNDIWGFQFQGDQQGGPKMAQLAAEYDCPVILMHNQNGTAYENLMGEVLLFLRKSIKIAENAGVKPDKIILDPGIGFGKDLDQNLEVMSRLEEFKSLGKPVLLGTSRKGMIGKVLDVPVTERVEGTGATCAIGIAKGVDIVRVHDVKEMVRVVKMTDAMVRRN